jgi:hypothetical protein
MCTPLARCCAWQSVAAQVQLAGNAALDDADRAALAARLQQLSLRLQAAGGDS